MLENQKDDVRDLTDEELDAKMRGEEQEQPQPVQEEEQQPLDEIVENQEADDEEEPLDEETSEPKNVVGDKAQKGLQREIAEQRKRRRELEHELAIMKAKIELQSQQPKVPEPRPFDDLTDDELVDGKAIKAVYGELEATKAEIAQQRQWLEEDRQRMAKERLDASVEQAQTLYAKGKVKEGYEYDSLMKEFAPVIAQNEQLANQIRNSANPALEAYKLALLSRDPLSLVRMPTPTQRKAKPAPTTVGSAPAGGGESNEINLSTLSREDISKLSESQLEAAMRKLG